MARFKISSVRTIASSLVAVAREKNSFEKNAGTLAFAGLLIVCSLAVGCSSEKPKAENSTNQSPITPVTSQAAITPASVPATPTPQASAKSVHRKVVHKARATVTYADKTSGVSFQYPPKYSLKTGEAASQLVSDGSAPMGFVQPGGVPVAAVAVPEGVYPKSDLASALFSVGVNKSLTAEQCGQFPVAQASPAPDSAPTPTSTAGPAESTEQAATPMPAAHAPKLMIGDMELRSNETLVTFGTRKQSSKYYHVFENGACYEFALKVATTGETDEGGKAVDRDEVFKRLGRILSTVKIDPVKSAEVTASVPVTAPTTAVVTPAQ